MLERLIKIKDSLCLYASKHNIPQISPEEWLHLNKLVSILQPFEEISRNMSDSNTSISSVIPLIHILKHTLQLEDNKPDTNETFKTTIKCTIEQLNSRFGDLHFNNFFAIATYLDPRYKTKFFNEVVKEKIESELISLLDSIDNSANQAEGTEAPAEKRARLAMLDANLASPAADVPSNIKSNVQSILSNLLMSSDDDDDTTTDEHPVDKFIVWKALLNEYNKEKRIPISDDPLLWWRVNTKFQIFYSLARQYLSCPPGSVASEQLFSGAGLIYDPLRNRLDGDKAAKLLFIKYNLPLLESLNLI